MKMMMIVYCEASDEIILAALKEAGVRAYSKMKDVSGEGTETEPKLGTHTWPGRNDVILTAVENGKVDALKKMILRLKAEHPRCGVRGFVFPMEESI